MPMSSQHPKQRKKSLMHNLGEFFGHIAQGVTSDPNAAKSLQNPAHPDDLPPSAAPPASAVRQQTLEQQVETPEGSLILRRTIIDEVRRADGSRETP